MSDVAIIGAGISGLAAARLLADAGHTVRVFEKSRGVGGRMSTRRTDYGGFDHGAQYFTVRDPDFQAQVDQWIESGLIANWPDPTNGESQRIVVLKNGAIESESAAQKRYVAVPAMNSICKQLAEGIDVVKRTRVKKIIDRDALEIELLDEAESSLGMFHHLIVSAPAEQTADMLGDSFGEIKKQLRTIKMNPCWATMVGLQAPIVDQWVGAFLHDSFLSWAAVNSSKPGRQRTVQQLVIHAAPEWTERHWECDPDDVAEDMLGEFWKVSGIQKAKPIHLKAHRWKYAIPFDSSNESDTNPILEDSSQSPRVVACGDWAVGGRVEGAWLSGVAAAKRLLSV